MSIPVDLAIVWAFIIAFAVFVYVVMDGFDLGLGILFPLFPKKEDRDVIMNSVAPVWDGNETWLVLGGGGMMAAFPLAYAVLMPALYTPMIAMLLGLVFRGVAFEFRWRTTAARNRWDIAFAGGSILATLAQGIALGAVLQGVHVEGRQYAGGWWDWLTLALFALSYAGLGISMYPYIVPQSITIWQAASPANSQLFMLFGVAVLIPLILGYTVWAYWVFRGKVKPESGYH